MKIFRDESGQTIIVAAVFMALLAIGFMALAVDVGQLFRYKRMAQSAATAAALAAAEEAGNGAASNEKTVANAMAKLNGLDTSLVTNPATVTLSTPLNGNFAGGAYITATVSVPVPTTFLGAFRSGMKYVTVSASATAGGGTASQTCICTGDTIKVANGASMTANGCGVIANDTSGSTTPISVAWGSTITSKSIAAPGTWDSAAGGVLCGSGSCAFPGTQIVQNLVTKCAIPTVVPPVVPQHSACLDDPGGTSKAQVYDPSLSGGVVCYKSLTVDGQGKSDTLMPGVYIINGGELHFESGLNTNGNGVFFYLTGGATNGVSSYASLVIDNGANVNIVSGTAKESDGTTAAPPVGGGAYNNTAIYQDANDTNPINYQGGSSSFINGAIVAPGATLTMANGSSGTVEGSIAVNSLDLEGGAALKATPDADEGQLNFFSTHPKLVQ